MRWTVGGVTCTDSPGQHLALRQRAVHVDLEQHLARPEEDRLVLLIVVLQAEGVALVDVNQLADVPVRLRPVQLVAPRLLHSRHVRHQYSLCIAAATGASSSRTSSAELARRARRASCIGVPAVDQPNALLDDRNRRGRHAERPESQTDEHAPPSRDRRPSRRRSKAAASRGARRPRRRAAAAARPVSPVRSGPPGARPCDRPPECTESGRWCRR